MSPTVKPVTVSVEVPNSAQEVYDFLDVLANHEAFTDHLLKKFEFSGPPRGVGAKLTALVNSPSSQDRWEIEVVETQPPRRIVEEGISAGGKRHTRGTYTLEELDGGGTKVSFELAWLEAPRGERMIAPLTRAFMHRVNGRSLKRLATQLPQPA